MSIFDYLIFGLYMAGVMGIGFYYFRRNKNTEDYFVGGRSIKAHHIGLSVVATDVGGGFSIGLGGVGFVMGLSGTWLLFTGLVGAWLSAIFIIPRVKALDLKHGMMTYPDFLRHRYGERVALLAALISGIGYLGFTGGQILAGAKLASGTFITKAPFGLTPLVFALLIIACITILYTVIGGLKAVIYTDTVQWMILMVGLILITIPFVMHEIGGLSAMRDHLPEKYFSLGNIGAATFVNWMVTIIPIWVIAMTLYQRIYACRTVREAQKAWFIAGLFEYPVMAFTGVFLGMCARVLVPEADPEMGLPLLIRNYLPIGITGVVIAAYFSAIMSTADSCLMASAGNITNDILQRYCIRNASQKILIRISQLVTMAVGIGAVVLASRFTQVLDAILFAYAFMVSGLLIPTLGAHFWGRSSSAGAIAAMLLGGTLTILLETGVLSLPFQLASAGLDSSFYGILLSTVAFITGSLLFPDRAIARVPTPDIAPHDTVESWGGAVLQHGPFNDRIYLMKVNANNIIPVAEGMEELACQKGYGKIVAKVPENHGIALKKRGFQEEARIPRFYEGHADALFLAKYMDPRRNQESNPELIGKILTEAEKKAKESEHPIDDSLSIETAKPEDLPQIANLYERVFKTYPFPIHDSAYLEQCMQEETIYFCIRHGQKIVAAASAEMDPDKKVAEMTDFATLPEYRGRNLAMVLLQRMEKQVKQRGIQTAYTIARAVSYGMNITFAKTGYAFAGTLANNTNICGNLESMNVWYKHL